MSNSLTILREQLKEIQNLYFYLSGGCTKVLEFSNYTITDDKIQISEDEKGEFVEINKKLKFLHDLFRNVENDIKKLI